MREIKHTLVFDMITANVMLSRGYQIEKIEVNRNNPCQMIYVFKGNLIDVKNEILKEMGLR